MGVNKFGYVMTICGILVFLSFLLFDFVFPDVRWVIDSKAIDYIADMTNASLVILINDDGNDNPIIHDITDVTFDVELYYSDGREMERQQFRCTDGIFRELICRGYSD